MDTLIKNISMSKEEIKKNEFEQFETKIKSIYSPKLYKLQDELLKKHKQFSSDIEFYKAVAYEFASEYIPKIIKDYKEYLSLNTIEKIYNIIAKENLKIFNPGEALAKGYVTLIKVVMLELLQYLI